jgi:hypothetical protein
LCISISGRFLALYTSARRRVTSLVCLGVYRACVAHTNSNPHSKLMLLMTISSKYAETIRQAFLQTLNTHNNAATCTLRSMLKLSYFLCFSIYINYTYNVEVIELVSIPIIIFLCLLLLNTMRKRLCG